VRTINQSLQEDGQWVINGHFAQTKTKSTKLFLNSLGEKFTVCEKKKNPQILRLAGFECLNQTTGGDGVTPRIKNLFTKQPLRKNIALCSHVCSLIG
jgi:hypothetical protein